MYSVEGSFAPHLHRQAVPNKVAAAKWQASLFCLALLLLCCLHVLVA